jgi:Flp pilus assembly pilin Flp
LFTPGSAQNRKGQELVEYALLAGFIAVSVAATIPYQITTPLSTIFNRIHMHLLANGG